MILKMIILAVCGVLLAVSLKNYKAEYSVVLSICISFVLLFFTVSLITEIKQQFSLFGSVINENATYFFILFKMIGITYLCEFCSGICKDAGYQSVGVQVETFGKITILLSGLPILMALMETIESFAV